jgi:hypothetical protein
MIKKPLSKEILFGKLKNGGVVSVDLAENKLVLNVIDILPVEKIVDESAESESE